MKSWINGLVGIVLAAQLSCAKDPLDDNAVNIHGDARTNKFLITKASRSEMARIESAIDKAGESSHVKIERLANRSGAYTIEINRPGTVEKNMQWLLETTTNSGLTGTLYYKPSNSGQNKGYRL